MLPINARPDPPPQQRGLLVAFSVGLLAAWATWCYVEQCFRYADPLPDDVAGVLADAPELRPQPAGRARQGENRRRQPRPEFVAAVADAERHFWRSQVKHSALVFGIFGGLLGAGLAIAESAGRRPMGAVAKAVAIAALLGIALGIAGGIGARLSLNQIYFWRSESGRRLSPMVVTMVVHAIAWSLVGLGVGIGYRLGAIGAKETGRNAIACMMGGWLAALAFTPLCSFFMPMGSTVPLVPEDSQPRLLWLALAGAAIASFPALTALRPPVAPDGAAASPPPAGA